jgi:hypothetical protein
MPALKLECSNGQCGIGRVAEKIGKWSGEHICVKSATCSQHKLSDKSFDKKICGCDESNEAGHKVFSASKLQE